MKRCEQHPALWNDEVDLLAGMLRDLSFRDKSGMEIGADEGFSRWRVLIHDLRAGGKTVYLIGNGASASIASHFAADLAKNARLHTQVFSDLSLITAVSNDLGYEHVFSVPLQSRGHEGDMLVAISSSGRSPNILAGVKTACDLGLTVVSLSAMDSDNPLRAAGDLNAYVPTDSYGYAETCHAAVLHRLMDSVQTVAGRKD